MSEATAQKMENLVALELRRRGRELFFARQQGEIDFLVVEDHALIQVCYSLQDPQVKKREVSAIRKFSENFPVERALVITMDETDVFGLGEEGIEVIPIWKWLLEAW
jgi:predicted AAA+ superfamily ATPase